MAFDVIPGGHFNFRQRVGKVFDLSRVQRQMICEKFHSVDRFFPSSKPCHCCGYKKEDLALNDKKECCPAYGETHDREVSASINLYYVGLVRPKLKPVE